MTRFISWLAYAIGLSIIVWMGYVLRDNVLLTVIALMTIVFTLGCIELQWFQSHSRQLWQHLEKLLRYHHEQEKSLGLRAEYDDWLHGLLRSYRSLSIYRLEGKVIALTDATG